MAGAPIRLPADCRKKLDMIGENPGLIFEFLDEDFDSSESSSSVSLSSNEEEMMMDEDEDETGIDFEENRAFWESQEELLQATLFRTTSLESKIRQATKDAIKEMNSVGINCRCRRTVTDFCRTCARKNVCDQLQNAGFKSAVICKSKWRSSLEIPSGEHTYIEVTQNSGSKRGEIKVIIELNFRAEFEMARASEEYNRLINRLPEVYVGKIERLRSLIKILCSAAKKFTKDRKMHMAPWRKFKYMEAKWLGTPEPKPAVNFPVADLGRPARPRASMLTFDLVDNLQSLHCTAIKVV